MTEQEAIERIYSKLMDGTPKDKDACDVAIDAFEKSYHYRAMERRLKAVYGDCDNLLETVVEGFCRHSGVDIGTQVKSRLLTDEDVDKWDAYRAIGTVEECREAVANKKKCEKQWHNDMENPLEPIKVYSALKSEILKLELRIKNRPKDISILDYTVIAALQKVLKNNLEGIEDE